MGLWLPDFRQKDLQTEKMKPDLMNAKETIRTSQFLSLILRHEPARVGLTLDRAGWVGVDELLKAVNKSGFPLTLDQLQRVVATNSKKRFAFSEDGRRIRASQGHSVEVDLQYPPQPPPEILYQRHGHAFPGGHTQGWPAEDGGGMMFTC